MIKSIREPNYWIEKDKKYPGNYTLNIETESCPKCLLGLTNLMMYGTMHFQSTRIRTKVNLALWHIMHLFSIRLPVLYKLQILKKVSWSWCYTWFGNWNTSFEIYFGTAPLSIYANVYVPGYVYIVSSSSAGMKYRCVGQCDGRHISKQWSFIGISWPRPTNKERWRRRAKWPNDMALST